MVAIGQRGRGAIRPPQPGARLWRRSWEAWSSGVCCNFVVEWEVKIDDQRLTRCSEQTENKAMKQTSLRTHRAVARLPPCGSYESLHSRRSCAMLPRRSENAGLCELGRLMTRWSCYRTLLRYLYRTVLTILLKNAFGFELRDRRRITGVPVGIDYAGRGMVLSAQGFRQKALSRYCVAFSRQKKVDRRTAGVHGPVQIYPLALDADVSLIHLARSRWSL